MSEYELKLMDIDSEHLGIPDTDYDVTVQMSSAEFQRICKDMASLGCESVKIEATKEGVRFSTEGELGTGAVQLKQNAVVDDVCETVCACVCDVMCSVTGDDGQFAFVLCS